ncbi:MAG: NUDIX hydrolase [Acidimicrobiales bacterium]|nr:NUDIX hydrolase [Acidimicrobiales bacterium]
MRKEGIRNLSKWIHLPQSNKPRTEGAFLIKPFEPIEEKLKFDGTLVSIYEGRFRTPSDEVVIREIAKHPGAVCIVPLVGEEVIMVRQYRSAANQYLLEIPAGKRDIPGESPEATAHRELIEEVGLKAGELQLMSEFYNSPGFCNEYSYCYLATDCVPVQDNRQGIEEEHMEIVRVALADVASLISEKRIIDAKSILGILLAKEYVA